MNLSAEALPILLMADSAFPRILAAVHSLAVLLPRLAHLLRSLSASFNTGSRESLPLRGMASPARSPAGRFMACHRLAIAIR